MQLILINILIFGGFLVYKISVTPEWQDWIGATATSLVRPLVIPAVELINTPAFVYVASFVILVSAILVSIAYYVRVVRPRVRQFRGLREAVQGLPTPEVRTVRSAAAMRQLGDALREREMFLSAWALFQGQATRDRAIPDTPFSYFAASDPTANGSERRGFMHALPGYFTSLGLIFTFIGLVVALYFAAKGFRSGNIEEARAAILQLLNASSFKFLTSVAALVSAMVVSLVARYALSIERHESEKTVSAIEAYIGAWRRVQNPADAAGDPMVEVARRLEAAVAGIAGLASRMDQMLDRLGAAPAQETLRPESIRHAAE